MATGKKGGRRKAVTPSEYWPLHVKAGRLYITTSAGRLDTHCGREITVWFFPGYAGWRGCLRQSINHFPKRVLQCFPETRIVLSVLVATLAARLLATEYTDTQV